MFASFRRFQKLIWAMAAVVIIPLFVIFFTPQAGTTFRRFMGGGDDGSGEFGRVSGERVERGAFLEAQKEVYLRTWLHTRRWPENDAEQINEQTYFRLLIIQQIQELGIHVSQEAVTRTALNYGISDVDQAIKQLPKVRFSYTKEDFIRYCEHEAGLVELTELAGVSGQLITPREAEERFKQQSQEVVLESVFFNWSDHTNGIAAGADAVSKYYTNYQSQYRLPERLVVSFAEFPKKDFLTQGDAALSQRVTNFTALIDQEYQRQGGTNFTDPNNPLVVLPEKEAKEQIKEKIRGQFALMAAHNKAAEVADRMMNLGDASLKTFEGSIAAEKIAVKTSSPFDRSHAPAEFKGVAPELAGRMFELTNSAAAVLFAPIMGEDSVFLAAVKERLPSQVEPFAAVRERATADYIKNQGRDLAMRAGNAFYMSLTNQMPAGKSFAEVAAASRLKVETLPPFSPSTDSLPELAGRIDINTLKNLSSRMTNGAISRFTYTADGGAVMHLRDRRPVSEAVRKEKYTTFLQQERLSRMNDVLNHWFEKIYQAKVQKPASAKSEEKPRAQR
ncbi:MAG TPA: hypothetical protein DCM86_14285 [Verrucomicrobiales bacterium]|nr:hypothetical protein [Verrucomicrobiales bacterium]